MYILNGMGTRVVERTVMMMGAVVGGWGGFDGCMWVGGVVYIFMVVNETHMLIRSYSKWRCHPGLLVEALWPKNRAQHLHQRTTCWWL